MTESSILLLLSCFLGSFVAINNSFSAKLPLQCNHFHHKSFKRSTLTFSIIAASAPLFIFPQYVHGSSPPGAAFAFSSPSTPKIGDNAPEHTLLEKDEIGLALAGGSIRAATTCYSVLRGFQQKRVSSPSTGEEISAMDLVKYNSGISGGSIPSVLYSYAQVPTEELLELDRTTDPSKITAESLSTMPKTSMGYVLARKPNVYPIILYSILHVLSNPTNIFGIHSLWSAAVRKKLCEPLNIPEGKYFTSTKGELEKILKDNPELKESDFLLPREDVKALPMILISMLGSRADNNEYEKKYKTINNAVWDEYKAQEGYSGSFFTNSFEKRPNMTELVLSIRDKHGSNLPMPYVITPDSVENKYSGTVQVWGNKVEFPEKTLKPFEWGVENMRFGSKRNRLSVELVIGMSTNFVATIGNTFAILVTGLRKTYLSNKSVMTQRFADGGTNDLMGIIPLVARGTKNIISIYNFNQNENYTNFADSYADIYKKAPCTSRTDPDFDMHFQTWIMYINPRIAGFFGYVNSKPINTAIIMNHIFHDPNLDQLKDLMVKYNSLFEAGEPLIATMKDLEVIDNPFWGISSGAGNKKKTVDLTLIYFNMPRKFSENVPEEVVPPPTVKGTKLEKLDKDGRFTNEELRVIPELPTDGLDVVKFSNEQVNMMGYLGSWMINHSWDGLQGLDGDILFEGFGKIFEKKKATC